MTHKYFVLALLISLFGSPFAFASLETRVFSNSDQESRYQQIIGELRCMVCQNQNLADSNADLAKDLRTKTYEMIISGRSDEEIVEFMVARYGNFVTYRPPLNGQTLLLWSTPGLLLIIGIVIAWRLVRPSQTNKLKTSLSRELQNKDILKNKTKR